jgi:cytochrome P450
MLIAGQESLAMAFCWLLKLLAANQHAQCELRYALHNEFPGITRQPTVSEILTLNRRVPYLHAVVEEALRVGSAGTNTIRQVMGDNVHVFGIHLPRDTTVMLLANGPGFIQPPLKGVEMPEHRRSERAQATKGRVGRWDEEDIASFKPEKWLVRDEKGEVSFNANAGPTIPFGLGPRACFGKKLAYTLMEMMIALLVWNFEIGDPGNELSSFQAEDKLTHSPLYCFVKLNPIESSA